jgi:hypothetical protein
MRAAVKYTEIRLRVGRLDADIQLDAVIAASLADAPSTRKSLPQTKWYEESQVQYIGDCDLQYAVAGSGMSAARPPWPLTVVATHRA